MEEKEFVIEKPVKRDGTTIITVVEKEVCCRETAGVRLCLAHKSPLYIVVLSASLKKAYRTDGEEVSLEWIADMVPGIRNMLQ